MTCHFILMLVARYWPCFCLMIVCVLYVGMCMYVFFFSFWFLWMHVCYFCSCGSLWSDVNKNHKEINCMSLWFYFALEGYVTGTIDIRRRQADAVFPVRHWSGWWSGRSDEQQLQPACQPRQPRGAYCCRVCTNHKEISWYVPWLCLMHTVIVLYVPLDTQ